MDLERLRIYRQGLLEILDGLGVILVPRRPVLDRRAHLRNEAHGTGLRERWLGCRRSVQDEVHLA